MGLALILPLNIILSNTSTISDIMNYIILSLLVFAGKKPMTRSP
jgi:hypothetical protein